MIKMRNAKLPESKFREVANERLKFIGTFHLQRSPIQDFEFWIFLWLQKPDLEIQDIYPQTIRNNIKSLYIINTQKVNHCHCKCS